MKFNNAVKIKNQRIKIEREIKSMVTVIGNDSVNFFKKSFSDQGFTDQTLSQWQGRKSKRDNTGRAILVKTGTLKRSIVKRTSGYTAIISSNVPYANVHNDGGSIRKRGRGGVFNMPKRQFVGNSRTLIQALKTKLNSRILAAFK
ncbi:MAG: phage virion morphogenesis protein [Bacteroidia bacterium]